MTENEVMTISDPGSEEEREPEGPSFWDEAVAQKEHDDMVFIERFYKRFIVIMGSQGVGKTEFLKYHIFHRNQSRIRPTLALLHYTGRKASIGSSMCSKQNLASIWEQGGGTTLLSTIDGVINTLAQAGMKGFTLIVMLDLSLPNKLCTTLETVLNHIRETIKRQRTIKFPALQAKLLTEAWDRVGGDRNKDKEYIDPFPVPLIILCGKYDIFKKFEIEKKNVICNWLRYTALTLGATLQFYSTNDIALVNRAQELLLSCAFADYDYEPSVALDNDGPLLIPFGNDSLEQIRGRNSRDSVSAHFLSQFPQDPVLKLVIPDDPSIGYPDAEIDSLIANLKKDKEKQDRELREEKDKRDWERRQKKVKRDQELRERKEDEKKPN